MVSFSLSSLSKCPTCSLMKAWRSVKRGPEGRGRLCPSFLSSPLFTADLRDDGSFLCGTSRESLVLCFSLMPFSLFAASSFAHLLALLFSSVSHPLLLNASAELIRKQSLFFFFLSGAKEKHHWLTTITTFVYKVQFAYYYFISVFFFL